MKVRSLYAGAYLELQGHGQARSQIPDLGGKGAIRKSALGLRTRSRFVPTSRASNLAHPDAPILPNFIHFGLGQCRERGAWRRP